MEKTFLFRCDANADVALGHLRRCLSLAHALSNEGAGVAFACLDDPAARQLLGKTPYRVEWLPDCVNRGNDINQTGRFLEEIQADVVVVDSYNVSVEYFNALQKEGKDFVYFEDALTTDWPVTGIINGLIGVEKHPYQSRVRLLGPDHLVLAPEYWNPAKAENTGPELNLMVTMGGIDHYDLSSRVIRQMNNYKDGLRIHIVVGQYYENINDIRQAADHSGHHVILHLQPQSIASIIQMCDLAVSAGGITLYELASCRVPAIGVWLWENQRQNVERLGEAGAIKPLAYDSDESFDGRLGASILELLENKESRLSMSATANRIVDGQGARRVARKLVEMPNGN